MEPALEFCTPARRTVRLSSKRSRGLAEADRVRSGRSSRRHMLHSTYGDISDRPDWSSPGRRARSLRPTRMRPPGRPPSACFATTGASRGRRPALLPSAQSMSSGLRADRAKNKSEPYQPARPSSACRSTQTMSDTTVVTGRVMTLLRTEPHSTSAVEVATRRGRFGLGPAAAAREGCICCRRWMRSDVDVDRDSGWSRRQRKR
jgi:hypothetical protein